VSLLVVCKKPLKEVSFMKVWSEIYWENLDIDHAVYSKFLDSYIPVETSVKVWNPELKDWDYVPLDRLLEFYKYGFVF